MNTEDTIAAVCTGVGGAISIIRISGPGSLGCLEKAWRGTRFPSEGDERRMLLGRLFPGSGPSGEPAMAVWMPGPRSYTGDDIVEIHCHGGALCTKRALELVLKCGARSAEPGEFTFRAFMNGKMDLTQAEAVCDLITAHSDMALHLAERQVSGSLGREIGALAERLMEILSECESRMDFPEEDLDWTEPEEYVVALNGLKDSILKLAETKKEGAVLREGIRVVIAGRPNTGKSSLLNRLLGFDRAIVTDLPGTTRDTLLESANLRGIPVTLTDTAGIREAENIIEGIGINRSRESLHQAQVIFWLLDASAKNPEVELAEMETHLKGKDNALCVWNKIDSAVTGKFPETLFPAVNISVKENIGIDSLLDAFEKIVWGRPHSSEPEIAVSERHAKLLRDAATAFPEAQSRIDGGDWELAAVQMRFALSRLNSITGEEAGPDVLDNIFSHFCIGK